MGIFDKKYDIKDLRIVYDTLNRTYNCYYGETLIPYSKLNKKSKKQIDIMQEKEIQKTKERFDKLKSLGYLCTSFEVLGSINGTMSKELEALLNNLVSEENILLGIHRIGNNNSPEKIQDILTNGLKLTGHLDGAIPNSQELKNNVSYYPNNKTIIKELMYADKYKDSKGSILIRIPDEDLTKNIFILDSQGITRLNPKYIIGYIPLEENHHIDTIITQNQIKTNNSQNNYTFKNNRANIQYYPEKKEHKSR